MARGPRQFLAGKGVAALVGNVAFIFVTEILQCAQNRIGSRLTEPAHGRVFHGLRQLEEQFEVARRATAFSDILQNFMHALRALAAGKTLAAGFVFQEAHEIFCDVHHAGVVVHDDHPARSHDGPGFGQTVIINRQVKHGGWNAPAGGSAGLNGLDLRLARGAAADVINDFANRRSERHFHQAGVLDLADQGKYLRARVVFHADLQIFGSAVVDDVGHVGQGLDVVNAGRVAEKAFLNREGRTLARFSHLSLDGFDQRRFLSADKRARAVEDFDVEIDALP